MTNQAVTNQDSDWLENQGDAHRTDASPTGAELKNQPAGGSFWSNISSAVRSWLQESAPEYDLESGRVVGERPRWQAIAPYVGISAATAVIFGGEALAPAVPSILGLGGSEAAAVGLTERVAQIHGVLDPIAQEMRTTAVLETDIGRIVAGGARDLAPAQRSLLTGSEIATQAPGVHAEITALQAAAKLGATPRAIAVSRAICPRCAAAIETSGGTMTSPTTAVWPGP